ncbi:hypothetical protein F4780DRAFT_430128 [Xylariomycetidae sp. FL0641]|nr:hypothetical protein F4780DRAFT_430128 [Xylariomycetidae sp. FL0641]
MGCGCERHTLRFQCGHKHRLFYDCALREFKKNFCCFAACLPACRRVKRASKIARGCDKCLKYFDSVFGANLGEFIFDQFLDYKRRTGLRRPIEPATVPKEMYLNPGQLASFRERTGQPFPAADPMRYAPQPPSESPESERGSFELAAAGALPDDYESASGSARRASRYPAVTEHGTGETIELDDLVEDDDFEDPHDNLDAEEQFPYQAPQGSAALPQLGHLPSTVVSHSAATPPLHHPRPKETFANPEDDAYPDVPKLQPAPRGRRRDAKGKQENKTMPRQSTPHPAAANPLRTAPTAYFREAGPASVGSGGDDGPDDPHRRSPRTAPVPRKGRADEELPFGFI